MSNLLDLAAHRRRRDATAKATTEAARCLSDVEDALLEHAVQLAFAGPLASWSDEQPIGHVVELDPASLRDLGDQDIRSLLDLRDQVREVLRAISAPRS